MSEIFDVEYWWNGHAEVQSDFGGPVSPVCATREKWQLVHPNLHPPCCEGGRSPHHNIPGPIVEQEKLLVV